MYRNLSFGVFGDILVINIMFLISLLIAIQKKIGGSCVAPVFNGSFRVWHPGFFMYLILYYFGFFVELCDC